jgi:hypothetical protein
MLPVLVIRLWCTGIETLAADDGGGAQHQVERAVDRAFGRILDRDHAEVGGAGLGGAEHFIDRHARQAFDGAAELLVHGLLAEGAGRAEIGHGDALFQRAAGRHDLAEDGLHFGPLSGPGLRSATPRSTCASRSGRNTGALVSALTWPTSCASWARRLSRSRICASIASICSRRGVSLSVMVCHAVDGTGGQSFHRPANSFK